ncbi:MAG: hypothetical protein WD597_00500 [Balneolaceae bacterium]
MKITKKAKEIYQITKQHFQENEHLHDDIGYTAFLLSLLPIPVFKELNQIIDRISSDKSLKIKFDDVWESIQITNSKVSKIENNLEKIQEIGGTVNFNADIKKKVEELVKEIISNLEEDSENEWVMETENWSYQEVLNSIVEADFTGIIARNNSTNVIENTEIKSKKTHLHASDNSQNFVDKTKFTGDKGSVGMDGITTKGNITVEGSGIGLGAGSAIIFGGNPNLVSGNCPFCNTHIQVDKRKLRGYSKVKCPNTSCGNELNFTIG